MEITFDGTEGGIIPESEARQQISNYKNGPVFNWNHGVKAHFYGKDILLDLLSQTGAKGIRMYYSSKVVVSDNTLQPELVLVAVDANGDDILNNNKIVDISIPCPRYCGNNGLG